MESRLCCSNLSRLGLIFLVAVIVGCGSEGGKEPKKGKWGVCPSLDSIKLSRKEVPSWDDTGHYSEVVLGIGFPDGNYSITKDDTVLVSGRIEDTIKNDLYAMFEEIETTDMEKIYHVSAVEEVELELCFFCENYVRSHMVKSFGQHGDNPPEIKEVYSYLLRFTHGKLQKTE